MQISRIEKHLGAFLGPFSSPLLTSLFISAPPSTKSSSLLSFSPRFLLSLLLLPIFSQSCSFHFLSSNPLQLVFLYCSHPCSCPHPAITPLLFLFSRGLVSRPPASFSSLSFCQSRLPLIPPFGFIQMTTMRFS